MIMEKEKYYTPEMDTTEFETDDIIVTSGDWSYDDDETGGSDG